jgi:PBP1b-binding outer membrane lipoprotein LpoB
MMRLATLILLASLLGGCGRDEPPPKEPQKKTGRVETRGVRNTQAIGMPGERVADKVDGALTQTEEQHQRMEEAERAAAGEAPADEAP